MWTLFWDMHSGGDTKEPPYDKIYIEAPIDEAKIIFYNRFGHNAERVTCTCCGDDYSIDEFPTLEQASAFHRNCAYDSVKQKYIEKSGADYKEYFTIEAYVKEKNVLIISKDQIKPEEKIGEVPEQGYVWQD